MWGYGQLTLCLLLFSSSVGSLSLPATFYNGELHHEPVEEANATPSPHFPWQSEPAYNSSIRPLVRDSGLI